MANTIKIRTKTDLENRLAARGIIIDSRVSYVSEWTISRVATSRIDEIRDTTILMCSGDVVTERDIIGRA